MTCTSPTFCVAVGWNDDPGQLPHDIVEQWDGTSWAVGTAATPPQLLPSCTLDRCVSESELYGVSCTSASFCVAVGYYMTHSNTTQPDYWHSWAERWDGVSWTPMVTPTANPFPSTNTLNAVSCLSATWCTAVGRSSDDGGLILRWDGVAWTRTGLAPPVGVGSTSTSVGNKLDRLDAVSCVSPTFCVAAGTTFLEIFVTLADVWNGSTWQAMLAPPYDLTNSTGFSGVACPSDVFCVGVLGSPFSRACLLPVCVPPNSTSRIERWQKVLPVPTVGLPPGVLPGT
ncbi:MAG: hypothetical protein ACYDH6_06035 [Acidimicrobiales bacterium]